MLHIPHAALSRAAFPPNTPLLHVLIHVLIDATRLPKVDVGYFEMGKSGLGEHDVLHPAPVNLVTFSDFCNPLTRRKKEACGSLGTIACRGVHATLQHGSFEGTRQSFFFFFFFFFSPWREGDNRLSHPSDQVGILWSIPHCRGVVGHSPSFSAIISFVLQR